MQNRRSKLQTRTKLQKIKIQKAELKDACAMRDLISAYAEEGKMLHRSLSSIYEDIRDYYVAKENGKVIGVCSLQIFWIDTAEIRSLAVHSDFSGKGIGTKLVEACINEAEKIGIKKLFTLTLIPEFFKKFGFKKIDAKKLPMKVWGDCKNCPKFMECDEISMMLEL